MYYWYVYTDEDELIDKVAWDVHYPLVDFDSLDFIRDKLVDMIPTGGIDGEVSLELVRQKRAMYSLLENLNTIELRLIYRDIESYIFRAGKGDNDMNVRFVAGVVRRALLNKLGTEERVDKNFEDYEQDNNTTAKLNNKLTWQVHDDSQPEVDVHGNTFWYNDQNELHRLDGPAVEFANGGRRWYQSGKRHRLDGPAIEYGNGDKEWYVGGKRHRLDGPAIEWTDGDKDWYINGIPIGKARDGFTAEDFENYKRENGITANLRLSWEVTDKIDASNVSELIKTLTWVLTNRSADTDAGRDADGVSKELKDEIEHHYSTLNYAIHRTNPADVGAAIEAVESLYNVTAMWNDADFKYLMDWLKANKSLPRPKRGLPRDIEPRELWNILRTREGRKLSWHVDGLPAYGEAGSIYVQYLEYGDTYDGEGEGLVRYLAFERQRADLDTVVDEEVLNRLNTDENNSWTYNNSWWGTAGGGDIHDDPGLWGVLIFAKDWSVLGNLVKHWHEFYKAHKDEMYDISEFIHAVNQRGLSSYYGDGPSSQATLAHQSLGWQVHREDSTPTVAADGTVWWYNRTGRLHRLDGPAIEWSNGKKTWCIDGLLVGTSLDGFTADDFEQYKRGRGITANIIGSSIAGNISNNKGIEIQVPPTELELLQS